MDHEHTNKKNKLGVVSGVYIPVCLNIISILMFLRFGHILGQIGLLGMLSLMLIAYLVDFVTTLSLSAIASNGEVKGGGAYYLISRSLGPEFGGSIGILFYLAQVLNTALNVVGLIDCLKLNLGHAMPQGYWMNYLLQTLALAGCTALCLAGSGIFSKASNGLLVILTLSIISIPFSALFRRPFTDHDAGIEFTGVNLATLRLNLLPHPSGLVFRGFDTFRQLFGILFPATSGIFAGASMSGDLRNPSKAIPKGTLWAMLSTFIAYLLVILALASSTTKDSLLKNANIIQQTNISAPIIFAGELSVTFFSALMGLIGSAKLMQALARDKLVPGLSMFGKGTARSDEPVRAIFLTYLVAQLAMFANLNQIATLISMGYQMTFFVMNLACFLLKIGSAPNFRPGFKFFSWQTAFAGAALSAFAMFFIDGTYATTAVFLMVTLFLLIHYLSPPKHWGDVTQNLIYHQVRKYLLRLKPEHIKFWRPQIILLINNPRKQTRLIQFCNSMKKGALYILGHVIVTDDFASGVLEAKLQQAAWTRYISEYSRIKAFVQLTMSPTITWGVRNLVLSSGLGGMRPNIAVMGFYNMDDLRGSQPKMQVPERPLSPSFKRKAPPLPETKGLRRRRGDTSVRLLEGVLPTDVIRTEGMMTPTDYLTILEDLALRYRLNVAVGKGFESLETPHRDGSNSKKFIDLWPIQMSAKISAEGKSVLTTNFDTYTLILQLGYILHTVPTWKKVFKLRVLVFVEYENEVEEERGRVKALLEKLRIDAEVVVNHLDCGQLCTYEAIIHGQFSSYETENLVTDCFKDQEWWADLQNWRSRSMTTSQELASTAHILESTAGRPGVYNPHGGAVVESAPKERRASVAFLSELKHPTMSALSRLGVSVGIHTHALPDKVLNHSDIEVGRESDSDDDDSEVGVDFNDAASEADLDDMEPAQRPLLAPARRRSHGDASDHPKSPKKKHKATEGLNPTPQAYGTISPGGTLGTDEDSTDPLTTRPSPLTGPPPRSNSASNLLPPRERAGWRSDPGTSSRSGQGSGNADLATMSQKVSTAMRFSSTLVPETRITNAEGGPKIMFAEDKQPRSFSRQSSFGHFSSRMLPETRITHEEETGPKVSFADYPAEPSSARRTPVDKTPKGSRRSSFSRRVEEGGDALLNIPELLHHIKLQQQRDSSESGGSAAEDDDDGMPLSFNDLPSRAQHLILNELMRQNSPDTAVLFTTLPIPEEHTCQSEKASMTYLSDIEVLCNDLPPTLLVLSNNMTVTVGL